MFNGGMEDNLWKYFQLHHQNSTTFMKWNGLYSVDHISEGKGNRQGGLASGEESNLYNNKMIQQLEEEATQTNKISFIPTSCVAVADDVVPCTTAEHPLDALHNMQHLLNVVEDYCKQLHKTNVNC